MGEYTANSKFYKPVVGESNANITVWDAALDAADADLANAASILSSPNSLIWHILYSSLRVDIAGVSYFSTERANGGTL